MRQLFQEICLNGHQIQIDKRNSESTGLYCMECGQKTITECVNCETPIEGIEEIPDYEYMNPSDCYLPRFCRNCGDPYPWTQKILNNAAELIALDTELSPDEKEVIKSTFPDLLIESNTTPLAEAKFKTIFPKVGKIVKDSLYNLLIDVLSESVKKSIFSE